MSEASRSEAVLDDKAPEKYFSVFGFVIVRKADLLAASAFIISLLTAIYQLYGYVRGAELDFYLPDRMYLFFDRYADGQTFLRAAGQVTFTNAGDPGRNGVVRNIEVEISLEKTVDGQNIKRPTSTQTWISFPKIKRDETHLSIDNTEDAHPVQVIGGATISQMMGFAPIPGDCDSDPLNCNRNYVNSDDFLKSLMTSKHLTLSFVSTLFGMRRVLRKSCTMSITDGLVWNLSTNGWFVGTCREAT